MLIQGSQTTNESQLLIHLWNAKQDSKCLDLELKDVEFSPALVSSFIDMLPSKSWQSLTLTNCHGGSIVNDVIWAVCASTATPITEFKLHQTTSSVDAMTFAAIAYGLKYAKHWRHLSLAVQTIDLEASNGLARSLARNMWLSSLSLAGSVLSPAAISPLSFGLRLNRSLSKLVLDGCALEDDQIALILQALQEHPTLKSLSIQQNSCHDQGMGAIAALLHYNDLEDLDMSYLLRKRTQPEPQAVEPAIVEEESKDEEQQAEEVDKSNEESNPDDKNMDNTAEDSNQGNEDSSDGPVEGQQQQTTPDDEVDNSDNTQKVRNMTLKSFQLAGNFLSDAFLDGLLGIFGEGSALEELNLFGNRISDFGLRLILKKIPTLKCLKTLWLGQNMFSCNAAKEFIPLMKSNYTLQDVNIRSFDDYGMESIQTTIEYYCRLNRGGRRIFAKDKGTIPLGLWPLILERTRHVFWGGGTSNTMSDSHAADVVYCLLHGPALFENPNVIIFHEQQK